MTKRKSGGSGRTTPKGTKSPKKKAHRHQPEAGGGGPESPQHDQAADHSTQWVSRPITHNRGNR